MKFSLNVVPPPREDQVGAAVPPSVQLSEPMRRFACNQKGCCCSGWDIPFRLEDFLRLHEALPENERGELTHGIRLVLGQEKTPEGEQILHSLKLDGVGDDKACRFLSTDGGCSVHRRFGLPALPDLCVDFPAFGYRRGDGAVELWFDPVCPEVLEQLDESDAPLELFKKEPGSFGDPGLDLRIAHTADRIGGRIGKHSLEWPALDLIRARSVEAFAADRAPWRSLAAVVHAYRRLRIGNEAAFEVVEPEDPRPFLQFLNDCISAHGADLLAATIARYRRFIWSIDPAPLFGGDDARAEGAASRGESLVEHLGAWQPAFEKWLAPSDDLLRPLTARWLAHRFGTPMVKGRGELREAADCIVHVYATSLRIAAAMGATLQRPVDRDLYKAALGAAEFFFRSLHLPREALPWFASLTEP